METKSFTRCLEVPRETQIVVIIYTPMTQQDYVIFLTKQLANRIPYNFDN